MFRHRRVGSCFATLATLILWTMCASALADDEILNMLPAILAGSGAAGGTYMIPDTAITQCYDGSQALVSCPTAGQDYYGQDAQFSPSSRQRSYTASGGITVTDNVTGLVWMWNGTNSVLTWQDAMNACGASSLGGASDWRLPDYHELSFLVDRSKYNNDPTIDAVFDCDDTYYWTSSGNAKLPDRAWYVSFDNGHTHFQGKTSSYAYRCVRSGKTFQASYRRDGDMIKDRTTGLVWMRETADTDTDGNIDVDDKVDWLNALDYCENSGYGGYTDWRLPDVHELQSLVKIDAHTPSINTTSFPDTASDEYWTNSPCPPTSATSAWYVSFEYGLSNCYYKNTEFYVRCVRSGP